MTSQSHFPHRQRERDRRLDEIVLATGCADVASRQLGTNTNASAASVISSCAVGQRPTADTVFCDRDRRTRHSVALCLPSRSATESIVIDGSPSPLLASAPTQGAGSSLELAGDDDEQAPPASPDDEHHDDGGRAAFGGPMLSSIQARCARWFFRVLDVRPGDTLIPPGRSIGRMGLFSVRQCGICRQFRGPISASYRMGCGAADSEVILTLSQ